MNTTISQNTGALAILAHECRTPLAAILYAAKWSRERPGDPDAQLEMCGIVERQAHSLTRMMEDVLHAVRCESGKVHLRKERCNLSSVIAGAVEATRHLLTERNHLLTLSLPAEMPLIFADRLNLQRVIVNLLTNAVKYTDACGSIRLSVRLVTDDVIIEVCDNGIGIERHLLSQVFDLFRQGYGDTDSSSMGLGVGLAVVKSIVELHGGTVSADSDGRGHGSRFTIRLPRSDRDSGIGINGFAACPPAEKRALIPREGGLAYAAPVVTDAAVTMRF
jgi:signal transduction histidine kinase